ncbi:MAG: transketolase [Candidatus Babeliales bacterium]
MDKNYKEFLAHCAYQLRRDCLRMTTHAGSGHITSCLSAADITAALFFYGIHFDPHNPRPIANDHFILSKGHAAPLLYAAYKQLGVITDDQLMTYRQFQSILEGHPTPRFSGALAATGSLGQGLSIAAGIAYAKRIAHILSYTFCLLGDSEMAEGSVWEAFEVAAFYELNHLIAIIDANRLGQTTQVMEAHDTHEFVIKAQAFGWHAIAVDGHNMQQLVDAINAARANTDKPTVIVAHTFKGYGLESVQDKEGFHGVAFKPELLAALENELQQRFSDAAQYRGNPKLTNIITVPNEVSRVRHSMCDGGKDAERGANISISFDTGPLATRKAYGIALAALGAENKKIVSLDAEVKNSTFAEIFEHAHPERFVQCFIAEQNMVSMAAGFAAMGFVPFVSTFGAFFSRAVDQIRMSAIGRLPLRLVGSHAGVSIGQDGPSQMALEDIAIMSAIPDSVILYPCDAYSTAQLVALMAAHDTSISYLRTTRGVTPQLYKDETFAIGGCSILRSSAHDATCIVAAGITVHEALKAYEILKKENITIAVIDAYSIKPLDVDTIVSVAEKSHKKIITVEDHYLHGGLGTAVCYALRNHNIAINCLAVTHIPMSGKPEELLRWAGIDAETIVGAVRGFSLD